MKTRSSRLTIVARAAGVLITLFAMLLPPPAAAAPLSQEDDCDPAAIAAAEAQVAELEALLAQTNKDKGNQLADYHFLKDDWHEARTRATLAQNRANDSARTAGYTEKWADTVRQLVAEKPGSQDIPQALERAVYRAEMAQGYAVEAVDGGNLQEVIALGNTIGALDQFAVDPGQGEKLPYTDAEYIQAANDLQAAAERSAEIAQENANRLADERAAAEAKKDEALGRFRTAKQAEDVVKADLAKARAYLAALRNACSYAKDSDGDYLPDRVEADMGMDPHDPYSTLPYESTTRTSTDIADTSMDGGDPINAATGEYHFTLPLLDLGGPIPLTFELYYGSQVDSKRWRDGLPFRFASNHRLTLEVFDGPPKKVYIQREFGEEIGFHQTDDGYEAFDLEGIRYQLKESGGYWYFFDPVRQWVYTFETHPRTGGVSVAFLIEIQDRNGNRLIYENPPDEGDPHPITYRGPDRVYDGLGRELRFTYEEIDTGEDPYVRYFLTRVEDQNGRAVELAYDPAAPDNPKPTYRDSATLRSIADPLENVTTFRYADLDRIASVIRPLGNVPYSQTYNEDYFDRGVVATQIDADGNTLTVTAEEFLAGMVYTMYSPRGGSRQIVGVRLASPESQFNMTLPDGGEQAFVHGQGTQVIESYTDPAGNEAAFFSDPTYRRITGVIDRLGDGTYFEYHPETGQIASITNARGETVAFTYAPRDQAFALAGGGSPVTFTLYDLSGIAYPDETRETFTYDDRGNVLTRTDRAGDVWPFTYDEHGKILSATDPAGGVTTSTYNDDGTLASRTDPEGGVTTFGYDEYKRLNRIGYPGVASIQFAYDLADYITAFVDQNGNTYAYEYDLNGNLVRATDPAGQIAEYTYDAMDRLALATDREGGVTAYTYDPMGRLASVTDPEGLETTFGWDPRGWLATVSRGGETWETAYDAEGMLESSTTPEGRTLTYLSDSLGQITENTDALEGTTGIFRDALGRITEMVDPDGRSVTFDYDSIGRLDSASLRSVASASYERDALGRVGGLTDLNGQSWSFDYTAMGRLESLTDPLGIPIQNSFDDRGRLLQTTVPGGPTVSFSQDPAGNLTGIRTSDGLDLEYSYDALNRLVETDGIRFTFDAEGRITDTQSPISNLPSQGFGATYDNAGRVESLNYGTFAVSYAYDPSTGLLKSVTDSLTNSKVELAYDGDGLLTQITRSNGVNTLLTYDAASRLTGLKDGDLLDLQYTLDPAGQVSGLTMTAPIDPASALAAGESAYQYDAASQLSGEGYASDSLGRLVAAPGALFRWDAISRLVGYEAAIGGQPPALSETEGSAVTLVYNGMGDVQARTAGEQTIRYHYNYALGLAPVVAEQDEATGKFLRYYVWAPDGTLLYVIEMGDRTEADTPVHPYFYHFDRAGSTLALTDAGGEVTDAYAYDPYGQLLAHTGTSEQPFTFVGRRGVRQEGEGGSLYHMRARYYDATTVRFLSRDPLWPNLADPRQLNPYQYAALDPVSNVDVTGMDVFFDGLGTGTDRLLGGGILQGAGYGFDAAVGILGQRETEAGFIPDIARLGMKYGTGLSAVLAHDAVLPKLEQMEREISEKAQEKIWEAQRRQVEILDTYPHAWPSGVGEEFNALNDEVRYWQLMREQAGTVSAEVYFFMRTPEEGLRSMQETLALFK